MKNFIILSAELTTRNAQENERMSHIQRTMIEASGLHYIKATGSYKGETEVSTMLPFSMPQDLEAVNVRQIIDDAFKVFEQESVLICTDGQARLLFGDGETMELGRWQNITRDEAMESEAWTEIMGVYYKAA